MNKDEKFVLASNLEVFLANIRKLAHIVSIAFTIFLYIVMIVISIALYPAEWFGLY